jgi:cephalosporin hydroxylase
MTPNNPVLTKLINDGYFQHRGLNYPLSHSTPISVCSRYYDIVVQNSYKEILEIGTLYGQSTLFLSAAAHETGGSVTTIDLRLATRKCSNGVDIINIHEVAERLVREAGYSDFVSFVEGNSNGVLANLYCAGRRFDFILIDGSHDFPVALLDFIYSDSLLNSGGVIALDDIGSNVARRSNFNGGPNKVLSMIFSSGKYKVEPINANVCLVRKL